MKKTTHRSSILNRYNWQITMLVTILAGGLLWLSAGRVFSSASGPSGASSVRSEPAAAPGVVAQQAVPMVVRSESAARHFQELTVKVPATGTLPVIVRLRVVADTEGDLPEGTFGGESEARRQAITQIQNELLARLQGYDPATVKRFKYLPFLALRVNESGMAALRASADVIDIQEDAALPPASVKSLSLIGEEFSAKTEYTGLGQSVVLLDTGVDKGQPYLAEKVVAEACFSSSDPGQAVSSLCPGGVPSSTVENSALPCNLADSGCDQGTRNAAMVSGNGDGMTGIAKESTIIPMQVFSRLDSRERCANGSDSCLVAYDSDIVSALERVYELRKSHTIAAVSLSLGGGRYAHNCDTTLAATRAAVEMLRGVGIATITAAGSNGFTDALSAPACISSTISVGTTGIGAEKRERVVPESNSAPFLSLLASGSLRSGMVAPAAPIVVGAFALMRQKSSHATIEDIQAALASTGEEIIDQRNGISKPRIRIDAAINAINSPKTAPVKPDGLIATTISATEIDLSWNDTTGETSYVILRRTSLFGTKVAVGTVGQNVTSFQNTGLTPGRTYYYTLRAVNSADSPETESFSDEVKATTEPLPPAPSGLTTTVISAKQINLSWTDNSTNETGFVIKRSTVTGGPYTSIATVAPDTTTYNSVDLKSGTKYYYVVVAINGGAESASSNEANGTTPEIVPTAPTGLAANVVSTTRIDLSWTDTSDNEINFKVQRAPALEDGTAGTYTQVAIVVSGTTIYQDSGLTKNTKYFYRVFASNVVGDSPASTPISATTLDTVPTAPSGLTALAASVSQINLAWADNSNNETGFKIERKTSGAAYSLITTTAAGATTYQNTGLIDNTAYTYRVSATNSGGDSTPTNEATETTLPLPDPPTGLDAAAASATSILLTWIDTAASPVDATNGYRIKRSSTTGGPYTQVGSTLKNIKTFTDSGLTPQTKYYYVVVGVNGNGESEISNEDSDTTRNLPAKPTNVVATADSSKQITVTWTDNTSDETGFKVERKSGSGSFILLTSLAPAGVTTYVDTSRISGQQSYIYRVSTVNLDGTSVPEESNSVTTPAGPPAAPSSLSATPASGTSITLTWTDNSETETNFIIERKNGADWTTPVVTTVGANVTTFTDTGLTTGTTYIYRVKSYSAAQGMIPEYYSEMSSNEAQATPPNKPAAVTGLTATAFSATRIDLSFTDSSNNEDGFKVRRKTGSGGTYAVIATLPATLAGVSGGTVNYSDSTASDGTVYYYSVTAVNVAGESDPLEVNATTLLPAPTGLNASPISATTIELHWADTSANESGFRIERKTGSGGTYAEIGTVGANVTSYQDSSSLVVETEYYYQVRSYNAATTSLYSSSSNTHLMSIPGAPTNLVATTSTATSANLSWTDNSSNESGFKIKRKTGSGGSFSQIAQVLANVTSYNDTSLSEGTEYFYTVTAYNVSGDSANSATDSVVTRSLPPTVLTTEIVSATSLKLAWTDNSGTETGYSIRRSINDVDYVEVATLAANTTQYIDTGLMSATQYFYRVYAVNSGGLSRPSNTATGTPPAVPAAPSALTANSPSSSQINLTWADNSTNETGFRIERKTGASGAWAVIEPSLPPNTTSYQNIGLLENQEYVYRVFAVNNGIDSTSSTEVTQKTVLNIPNMPTDLKATVRSGTQITLSWTDNSTTETGFEIDRQAAGGVFTKIASPGPNVTFWDDIGLSLGNSYTYRMRAVNTSGPSANTASVTALTTSSVPTAPTGLTATTFSSYQINLNWTDASNSETGFKIRRRISGGADAVIGTVLANSTTYQDIGLKAGVTYYYTVTAYSDNVESIASNLASARTIDVAPNAPSEVTAVVISPTQVNVSWKDNSDNETGFKVQRKTGTDAYGDISPELPENATTYQDKSVLPLTTYSYRVVSFNVIGVSTSTIDPTVSTPEALPGAPTLLTATAVSSFQVNLSWKDNATNEIGFRIWRKSSTTDWALLKTLGSNVTTYQDVGLEEDVTYTYRVLAYNGSGGSLPTDDVSVTMPKLPAAATGLGATAKSAFEIELTWTDSATNETGYRIYRKLEGGSYALVATTAKDSIKYTNSGLSEATKYYYIVVAFNDGGESDPSTDAYATTKTRPVAPTGLTATTFSASRIDLTWSYVGVGLSNQTGFKIVRSTTPGGPYTIVSPSPAGAGPAGTDRAYSNTGLVSKRKYYYRVLAINDSDESDPSNEANAETLDGAPDTPTGLTAVASSTTSVTLTWTDNSSNEVAFDILRSNDSFMTSTPIVAAEDATTLVDSPVTPGQTYSYKIQARNASGLVSSFSNVATVKVPSGAPLVPTSVAAKTVSASALDLTWVDPADTISLRISRSIGNNTGYSVIGTVLAGVQVYSDTGLQEGTLYFYKVEAINIAGTSPSAEVSQTTRPSAPINLTATVASSTKINLTWIDTSANETGFKIMQKTSSGGYSQLITVTANVTSYQVTGLTPSTTYTYQIYAMKSSVESAASNESSATPPPLPSAPTSLLAVVNSGTQVTLTWTDNADNEDGFIIERKAEAAGTWAEAGRVAANIKTYVNSGLLPGINYYFRVSAYNSGGTSATSNEALGKTPGYAPNAPTSVTATPVSSNQVNLTWVDNSDNEQGFKIQRKTGSTGAWLTLTTLAANVTTYQSLNLIAGRTYYFRIVAFNNDGDTFSAEVQAQTPLTVPAAPNTLTATASAYYQVDLAWADNSGTEDGFRIERKTGLGLTWTVLATVAADVKTYQDTGLSANTNYYYRVFAFNGVGDSLSSEEVFIKTPLAVAAPTLLTATAPSSSQVNLSWKDNASNETGFRIQRKTGAAGIWAEIATVGSNIVTYQNTGLTAGTIYYYRVFAYNSTSDSLSSNEVNITTPTGGPMAPTNLVATAVSSSQINLTWTDNSTNETGFRIRRRNSAGGTYSDLGTVTSNVTTYSDTGLSGGVTYYYIVIAVNGSSDSANSNEASATTPTGDSLLPPTPGNLVAAASGSTQINLTWIDNSVNETGFKIRRKTGVGGSWAEIATIAANLTSYSDTGLTAGLTYFYTVAAVNASGESTVSNEASATTQGGGTSPLAAPSNLQVTALTTASDQLSWTDTSSAESGFRIYRKLGLSGTWGPLTTVGPNVTTYQDLNLLSNSTYYYRVTAFDATTESDPSNEHTLTVPVYNFVAMTNGQAYSDGVGRNQSSYYRIYVPSGATSLLVTLSGNNDANLLIRYDRQPTSYSYNCRSASATSTEQCRVDAPLAGDWHVQVLGVSTGTSNFTVTATYSGGGTVSAPTAPTTLVATANSSTQITLTWVDTSNNETNFRIRRRTSTTGTWTLISTVGENVATYQDTGLTAGTTYYYYVTSYNVAGESGNSNEANATTQSTTPTTPTTPTTLVATAASTSQINLSWIDASSNETGFRIKRRTSGTTLTQIAEVAQNVTTFQDTGLASGVTYFYTVFAYNSTGNSSDSNEASATTQTASQTAPTAPTTLAATAASTTQINLSWVDTSSNETGFRIKRRTSATSLTELTTVGPGVTTYQDNGLTAGTTYFYTVASYNSAGSSADSSEASATTQSGGGGGGGGTTLPEVPTNVQVTATSTSAAVLSWTDASTSETGFRVYRKTGSTGTYALVSTLAANVTNYQETGLIPYATYYYKVTSYNGVGESTFSGEVSVTIPIYAFTAVTNGQSVSNSVTRNDSLFYRLYVPSGATNLTVVTTGSGDANLYVRYDKQPTAYSYNCRSNNANTSESCVIAAVPAGDWHIQVIGVATSPSSFTMKASYTGGGTVSVPSTPTNLVATAASSSQINLSWIDASSNETGFRIKRRTSSTTAVEVGTVGQNVNTYQDTSLTAGVTYYYTVVAYNATGNSVDSNEAGATTPSGEVTIPTPPATLAATAVSTSQINLTWVDSSTNETGFRIKRRTSGGVASEIATVGQNVATYQDTGLASGTTYYYTVVAYNSAGNSSDSNEANATTQSAVPTLPAPPSGLTATTASSSQINLSWTDGSNNESGFRIKRRSGGGLATEIATVSPNVTTYQDTGLTGGVTYYYTVLAYNSVGNSAESNEASATTTSGGGGTPPTAPSSLLASALTTSSASLNWTDNSSNETGFRIQRKSGATGTWAVIGTTLQNVKTYQDTGLVPYTTYYYRVTSYNSSGESAASNEANVTIPIYAFTTMANGQSVSDSVARNQSSFFRIYVPEGMTEMVVTTTGNADANLFVRYDKQPSTYSYNCRSIVVGSTYETCRITTPLVGDWHIMVANNGVTPSNFVVTATYSASTKAATNPGNQ